MATPLSPRTRTLTVIAQDPSVLRPDGNILTARVEVPAERLAPGPWGHRVHVIDYDASTGRLYRPRTDAADRDPYEHVRDASRLLDDPCFHAQNCYAVAMSTLARFERALGRRVSWGFSGHQLKVAPHAFLDANAFYSRRDEALMFGWFHSDTGPVYACLSHDVVAHETTHAVLDGLRERYTDPSSPDQAAFHEGFADVVALLSVFAMPEVVAVALGARPGPRRDVLPRSALTPDALRRSALLGLAEQMGRQLQNVRGAALRRSALLEPDRRLYRAPEYLEPHRRGELLVAAMMNAFVQVWAARLEALREIQRGCLDRERVVQEGADVADRLLTTAIRALDYAPPVDLQFGDYLRGLLAADREDQPDDRRYLCRDALERTFRAYGIDPAAETSAAGRRSWLLRPGGVDVEGTHFASMQHEPDEVFRFVWQNRELLELSDDAYTRVLSVRPCTRVAGDGFVLHETVAEYVQILDLQPDELRSLGIRRPAGMPDDLSVTLYGGGVLVFDEYGRLKLHVSKSVRDAEEQSVRLAYLAAHGGLRGPGARRFSALHRRRNLARIERPAERW
ncbi:MAG: hypothetical protein HY905_02965 [Deltaproteobacteria bacterium]|nr:hypothetical protein [Deltaproteobacteria bacterium]